MALAGADDSFSNNLLQYLRVQAQIGHQPFQAPVVLFQLLQPRLISARIRPPYLLRHL